MKVDPGREQVQVQHRVEICPSGGGGPGHGAKKGASIQCKKRGPDTTSKYLATRESNKINLDNLETMAVR